MLTAVPARKWDRLCFGSAVGELMEVLHLERTHSRFYIPCLRKAGSELSAKLFYACRAPERQTPESSSAAAPFWLWHVAELTGILVTEVLRDQPP